MTTTAAPPTSPLPAPRRTPHRRRRWIIPLVSVATLVWLVAELSAGAMMRDRGWPVTGFSMFREERNTYVRPYLEFRTAGGETIIPTPQSFGLERQQFVNYIRFRMAERDGTVHPGARERLARVVRIWSERHPGERVVEATVLHDVTRLPYEQRVVETRRMVTWRP